MSISSLLQSKPAPSVRVSLAALVVACVLPVAAMATFLVVDFYATERARLIAQTVVRAHTAIAEVDHDIGATALVLQSLATSRVLAAGDLAAFHQRATKTLARLPADSIFLLAPSGQMLMSTRLPYGAPLPLLATVPLLRRIAASGRPEVSDLFDGPLSGHLIYAVGVPLRRDGAAADTAATDQARVDTNANPAAATNAGSSVAASAGIPIAMTLNATATPAHLMAVLTDQKLPSSWRACIVDRQYRIVARTHDGARYVGRQLGADWRRQFDTLSEGGFETRSLEGIAIYVVFSRSAVSGWGAVIGIPLDQLTAGLRATLAWLVAATLAALALGLALAWLIGGRIAQSVQALIPPALALGDGHVAPLPRLHFSEARQLGLALQHAADGMRRVQAGMRESEQRLALVADAAHLGVWVRDLTRRSIWISDQWRALFGFAPTQTVQLPDLLERVHPDDRVAVQRTLDQAQAGVPRYDMEYRIVLPHGELRWIGSHGSVTLGPDGRPALVHGVSLDITPRKRAELDLQQKQKEVTHLSRVAVLGELSGALAHELNQPLTAILSNAQAALRFMEREPVDLEEVREILQDIVGEDQRAGEIIRRLRRLFDKNEMPRQRCDLDALVRDTVRLLRNDLINHGITVLTELCGDAAVHADRVQLQQVLINLLMNGCDAMAIHPGGTIVVRTRRLSSAAAVHADAAERAAVDVAVQGMGARMAGADDRAADAGAGAARNADTVELIVADNGAGIAPADLERIFEPFYTTKERGMGLGLSICRSIVGAHGGRLWAGHNPDGGARFYLRLPLADGDAP